MLMKSRNDDVTAKLKNNYAEEIGNGSLEIFCVSSSEYEKCFDKEETRDSFRRIGLSASGIPALRDRCSLITADGNLLEAKNLICGTLPATINEVRL